MRKKTKILLISYVTAAMAILGGVAYSGWTTAAYYKLQVDTGFQHAFSELVNGVMEIDSSLQKSLYATSPSLACASYTDIFGKSMAAQMSLAELPFSDYLLERTAGFISSVGDYSLMLSKKAAGGSERTEEEYNNLVSLSQTASMLANSLIDLQGRINDGSITIQELKESQNALSEAEDGISTLGQGFMTIETEFPEIPSLIYDGPFSQHIQDMQPQYLAGKAEVSAEDAKKRAADFTGITNLELFCEKEGNLPVYTFSADTGNGIISVDVTKVGGEILSIYDSRGVTEVKIKPEDAVEIATRYLNEHGYDSVQESYWSVSGNTAIVNFAYMQNGVICYPDLIKVAVALDDGSVMGFEAHGYIMNHLSRDIPLPSIDEATARQKVPDSLTVLSHSLAVIPTDGKYETFCHEFKCENSDDRPYIIYVNATTGEQEKILILIEDESGTLTL